MDIKQITPFLSVASQLSISDLGIASAQGFRTIINNRPDGEADDQPTSDELAGAAAALGLDYLYLPVVPGQVTDDDVAAYRDAEARIIGPVLGFCRTGTRAITLWALAEARHLDPAAILRVRLAPGTIWAAWRHACRRCTQPRRAERPPGRRTRLMRHARRPTQSTSSPSSTARGPARSSATTPPVASSTASG